MVEVTTDASPRPSAGTVVVGMAPDHDDGHVLHRALDDAARWDLDDVVALVVVDPPPFSWLWSGHAPDGELRALEHRVRDRLGGQVDVRVVEGPPVATLTEASDGSSGLYVGRGPEPTVGPVALGCVFSARCPVTLVPPHEPDGSRGPVVVGLDDSQCGRAAVEHAIDEGGRIERVVLVISVFDVSGAGTHARTAAVGEEVRRAVEVRTRSTVRDLMERRERARRPGVTVEVGVLEGPPAAMLCEVAGRVGASLLVVGARGRGHADVGRSPIGSVATRVVLRAPGAVRVIRGTLR